MLFNEAPSASLIKAVKNYWEIIFSVFAGATIIAATLGFGILGSFSTGLAVGATLGVWVSLKKYETKFHDQAEIHEQSKGSQ